MLDADGVVTLGGARQRALLAVLLLHANETLSADRLIDELWGDAPPPTAAKTVQVYISRLRRALKDPAMIATREPGYALRLDRERLDAHRFERMIAEGRAELAAGQPGRAAATLDSALSLWRGTPLADLADERFAERERSRLEDLRVTALEQLTEAELALGQHAHLLERLERLVAEHPYRERFRAQLMLALYRCDRQADALAAYRDARRRLADELGIEPGERLRELERAILTQDPRLDLAPVTPVPAAEVLAGAFVGRERELGALIAGLDDAVAGQGRLFLLVGEPGIGKSRLAEELSAQARSRGAQVLVGRCWEAGGAPAYWPWVQSLRGYVRRADPDTLRAQLGPGAVDVAQLLPELRTVLPDLPPAPAVESEGARFRLFDSLTAFLHSLAAAQPLVLVLDDLHAADEPSLLLLRFVARELGHSRVLIVGAFRDVDPTVSEPLQRAVAELTREPLTRSLPLTGLSQADVAQFLEPASAPPELVAAVHAETEGNPLFVGEIVRLLGKEGRVTIPHSIRDTIGRRLRHLSDECNELLLYASVLGREFDLTVLARVSGHDRGSVLELLDEAMQARVVSDVPGSIGRMRFAHALIRDAAYRSLARARRLELHRRVGAALEAVHQGDLEPHLAEVAHHFFLGGAPEAVEYASRAGARAVALHAYEEAVRLYEIGLAALHNATPVEHCRLLLALGDAQGRQGDDVRAKATFLRATELARTAGEAELFARAAAGYGGRFLWSHGLTDERLVPLLEEGVATVGSQDSALRVRLLSRLAAALRHGPTRARREVLMGEAIEMARRIGDPVTIASALTAAESALHAPHTARQRLANAGEIVELATVAGDRERLFDGHEHAFWASWELGDPERRGRELLEMTRCAHDLRQPAQLWMLAAAHATFALAQGRFDEAPELIRRAAEIGEPVLAWNAGAARTLQRFLLCCERGGLEEYLAEVRDDEPAFPSPLVHRSVLAHGYARLGRLEEAAPLVAEITSHDLADWHVDEQWFCSICLLAETCARLDDPACAACLYELLAPYADHNAVAVPEMAMDSTARPLGILATLLERYDEAEEHFRAAAAMNERMGARGWLAHTWAEHAALRQRRGDRATELVAQAEATYRELGMTGEAASRYRRPRPRLPR
ncbi:AAA family ATPase [Solirubrobacter sp. CPCC 204708]|uniref:AAA family ATPase n=1 Tax=Solirubrobacter deserti TaxID=2282478 RepID=A0ABT4RF38_9ACTN|nr:AfsR/SARP family transcriptional regulator [Solirubrobacter deserti]MBE2319568.1 AAA family ATPase [Solirubrobacter deserti]MDA0137145.1 AAA family ATPase [Solirubrobacter deserti]